MNRVDDRVATEALPNFLHQAEGETEGYTDDVEGDEAYAEEALDQETDRITEAADAGFDEAEPTMNRSTRSSRARRARNQRSGVGVVAMFLGAFCWLGAVGLGAAGDKVPDLSGYGITPAVLLIVGAIAFAAGCMRRWIGEGQNNRAYDYDSGGNEDVSSQLAELLDRQSAAEETSGITQQILLSMQRQDEKTNNLTKAIKMYGKPLMDIANHGTELAATMAQVRTAVEAGNETARQAYSRIETQVRENGENGGGEELGRLEVSLQAVAQRLEDNEVRKSLVRLEDSVSKTQEELQQLLRSESLDAAAKNIQDDLKSATSKLHAGIEELREGNLSDLDKTVRGIQREVATVATAVSQIQASIKGGAITSSAKATANAAPAAAAPTADATPSPAAAATGGEATGYKTGARRSGSKNVLGAIAKLKQMKS